MISCLEMLNGLSGEAKSIFSLIQKDGPLSKSNISLISKLKLTTLIRIMQPLEDMGLIVQSGIGESIGGRKPVLYDVSPDWAYIVGIDISRLYVKVLITNLKMDTVGEKHFRVDKTCTPDKTISFISQAIHSLLSELKMDKCKLLGIGVGTVGPLDREKGIMLNPDYFEPAGWANVPVKEKLELEHKLSVFVDNGANTAILAETLYGKGKGFKNLAYVNCGVGIRTAAISSGTIIRTINDAEDAFGHMVLDVDGEPCNCGNYGCIECYSSINSIVKKFISELKKGRTCSIKKPISDMDFRDICLAAERGDVLASEVITSSAAILGIGLANFINLMNPGMVILSGQLIKHSPLFYNTCTEIAVKKCYLKKDGGVIFCKGAYFEDNAIALGSAALVVEKYLDSRIVYG